MGRNSKEPEWFPEAIEEGVAQIMGFATRHNDVEFDDLSPDQQDDIMHGDACGHFTNRPKTKEAARQSRWGVENGKVTSRVIVNRHSLTKFFSN